MEFKKDDVSMQPEILKRLLGGELFAPITVAAAAFTKGVCKAGTALATDGTKAVVASEKSNAVGILRNDVYEKNPNGSLIKAYATVSKAAIKKNTGTDVAVETITALPNVTFED